jgi:hypothetical protein
MRRNVHGSGVAPWLVCRSPVSAVVGPVNMFKGCGKAWGLCALLAGLLACSSAYGPKDLIGTWEGASKEMSSVVVSFAADGRCRLEYVDPQGDFHRLSGDYEADFSKTPVSLSIPSSGDPIPFAWEASRRSGGCVLSRLIPRPRSCSSAGPNRQGRPREPNRGPAGVGRPLVQRCISRRPAAGGWRRDLSVTPYPISENSSPTGGRAEAQLRPRLRGALPWLV